LIPLIPVSEIKGVREVNSLMLMVDSLILLTEDIIHHGLIVIITKLSVVIIDSTSWLPPTLRSLGAKTLEVQGRGR